MSFKNIPYKDFIEHEYKKAVSSVFNFKKSQITNPYIQFKELVKNIFVLAF